MTITLEPELQQKLEAAAARAGQDINGYVHAALLRQLAEQDAVLTDKKARDEQLRHEFEEAMRDPLFVQDMEETMEAYKYVDAETARMMDEEDAA